VGIRPHGGAQRESTPATAEVTSIEAEVVERADRSVDGNSLSPVVLAYVVGPLAFVVLMVFRHFGLVARLPVWAYLIAIFGSGVLSILVEPWHQSPAGSVKLHCRLFIHISAVTVVIYMSGWGPALVMAYSFVALEELQQWGASLWRPLLAWSLVNVAFAQWLLWMGLTPSFLSHAQAETVGALGAFVLAIVIRMAGATGEKKEQAEALLAHQALHDGLTGLPNRAYFFERTIEAIELSATRETECAVMLFDLDRFKEINDTMGHKYGDRVLIELGPRARAVLRAGDTLARLGGDEFCVLLPDVSSEEDALTVAHRIIEVLEEPFTIEGVNLGIEASCGIAVAPGLECTADLLLQRADVAMYAAKESNDAVVVYREEIDPNRTGHLALLGDLRHALANDEFVLHYQPKAAMGSRRVLGVEALIRWQHPTLGLVYPDRFIPEAERSGLIEPITYWVLDQALGQCRAWLDSNDPQSASGLTVAVNLSTRSLLDASLPSIVASALARWNVPAHLLELEITETIIMTDPKRARRVLTELADMGITLSIDDFGTGYSSLAYLRDLPVTQLKIDRTFVLDMGEDPDDAVIVRAVLDLASNLGLQTVAEGVEDAETWEQLTSLGCDSAQGYFLARPMAVEQFDDWLAGHVDQVGCSDPTVDRPPLMSRMGLSQVLR
jgi:diguanylate cyclase (GGDEF)-like protein